MYNWAKKTTWNRAYSNRPWFEMKRVKDNGRRNVNFFNAEKLRAEEKYWSEYFKKHIAKKDSAWGWDTATELYAAHLEKLEKETEHAEPAVSTIQSSGAAQSFTIHELLAAAKKHNMTVTFENGKLMIAA